MKRKKLISFIVIILCAGILVIVGNTVSKFREMSYEIETLNNKLGMEKYTKMANYKRAIRDLKLYASELLLSKDVGHLEIEKQIKDVFYRVDYFQRDLWNTFIIEDPYKDSSGRYIDGINTFYIIENVEELNKKTELNEDEKEYLQEVILCCEFILESIEYVDVEYDINKEPEVFADFTVFHKFLRDIGKYIEENRNILYKDYVGNRKNYTPKKAVFVSEEARSKGENFVNEVFNNSIDVKNSYDFVVGGLKYELDMFGEFDSGMILRINDDEVYEKMDLRIKEAEDSNSIKSESELEEIAWTIANLLNESNYFLQKVVDNGNSSMAWFTFEYLENGVYDFRKDLFIQMYKDGTIESIVFNTEPFVNEIKEVDISKEEAISVIKDEYKDRIVDIKLILNSDENMNDVYLYEIEVKVGEENIFIVVNGKNGEVENYWINSLLR